MNRDDRTNFLTLIDERKPELLADVDREHVTDEQIMALVAQAMAASPSEPAAPRASTPTAAGVAHRVLHAVIEAHDLMYHDHESVRIEEQGRVRQVWRAVQRPLSASDVLASRMVRGLVRFVAKDGRRYELPRNPTTSDTP